MLTKIALTEAAEAQEQRLDIIAALEALIHLADTEEDLLQVCVVALQQEVVLEQQSLERPIIEAQATAQEAVVLIEILAIPLEVLAVALEVQEAIEVLAAALEVLVGLPDQVVALLGHQVDLHDLAAVADHLAEEEDKNHQTA